MDLHAILVPFPAQGHINPTFQLALKLLHGDGGFKYISFINTSYNHDRIVTNGRCQDLLCLPGLKLISIDDGLPTDHGRLNDPRIEQFGDAIDALHESMHSLICDIVRKASSDSVDTTPVACIISDVYFYWMPDIADAVGVPWVPFWTTPASASLAYCSINQLLDEKLVPVNVTHSESTEKVVDCILGMHPLRAWELPSFLQSTSGKVSDFFFQWCVRRFDHRILKRAKWHLCHALYELDKDGLDAFEQLLNIKCFPVGPLLPSPFFSAEMDTWPAMDTSIWPTDEGCKKWLDKQKARSVLYISFGSIAHMEAQQVEELEAGIIASEQPFLWALRPDTYVSTLENLEEFKKRTRHQGLIVSWAPQLSVLSHRSVGAFFTHCGWNSILEPMAGGVPLLAWPGGFSEQAMNSRYVAEFWRNGLGLGKQQTGNGHEMLNRNEVKIAISTIFSKSSQKGKEVRERAAELQKIVREAVLCPDGSSETNLRCLIREIRSLKLAQKPN
ncbi:hypothetical protein KP509_13G086600 [Ceratopteris richardii]|uniref:Glycosyltransferase n=1 Tax=Ceratopteris richardii TaxID=49495 RepID=A0A8T2TN62_CERRI|nr:hypothetical protein KP509_13G086600 [Ceratopteris richardii]